MKTPWNNLARTRQNEGLIDVIGYLNDTLDELLSLAKHLAPAIERIAYPDRYLADDADGIKAKTTHDYVKQLWSQLSAEEIRAIGETVERMHRERS